MLFAFQADQKRRRRRWWAGHIGSIGSEGRRFLFFLIIMIVVCLMETTNIYRRRRRGRKRKWRYITLINSCRASNVRERNQRIYRVFWILSHPEKHRTNRWNSRINENDSFKRRAHAYVQNKTMTLASNSNPSFGTSLQQRNKMHNVYCSVQCIRLRCGNREPSRSLIEFFWYSVNPPFL
jgi:hypothetical protein